MSEKRGVRSDNRSAVRNKVHETDRSGSVSGGVNGQARELQDRTLGDIGDVDFV